MRGLLLFFLLYFPTVSYGANQPYEDAALQRKIETALAETQQALGQVMASITQTQVQIENLHQELATLHQQEEALKLHLSENIQKHHVALANLARLERQPLRAFLTYDLFKVQPQRQPILAISRKELQNRIQENRQQLAALLKITYAKEEHQKALATAVAELEKHQKHIASLKAEQQQLLSLPPAERRQLQEKAERLARRGNLKQLLALTNSLSGVQANLPKEDKQNLPNLPVEGVVLLNFGQNDPKTDIPTNGMVIKSIAEQDVLAIHEGRVLYAGPFKGFGILMILEHKGGVHSLYGGVGKSYYEVGAFVPAGSAIATLPKEEHPHLYLEVRQNGKPIDPKNWLPTQNG